MFSSVIAALDLTPEGDRSLPVAAALARQGDADLVLLTVHPIGAGWDYLADLDQRLDGLEGARATSRLVESEHVSVALADAASARGALLCTATHRRNLGGQLRSDSTTLHTLRRGRAPIVVTGPDALAVEPGRAFEAVTLCLDGSAAADHALDVAVDLAHQLRIPVQLLAVEEVGYDGLGATGTGLVEHLAEVACRIAPPDGRTVRCVVDRGRPAEQIVAFAAGAGPGALLVIASHGATSLERMLVGSVTAEVVRTAPCPVVVVPIPRTGLDDEPRAER